jgi:hypothetical protein
LQGIFTASEEILNGREATPFQDAEQSVNPLPKVPISGTQEQLLTTASLAALAQMRNKQTEERFNDLVARNAELIELGGEDELRSSISSSKQAKQIESIRQLQQDVLEQTTPDPALKDLSLMDFVNRELEIAQMSTDKDALEDEGVAQVQDTARRDGDQNLAADLSEERSPGVLDQIHTNSVKLQLWNREVDKLTREFNNEPWWQQIIDTVEMMVPMNLFMSTLGLQPNVDKEFTDLPSTKLQKEMEAFWSQDLASFKANLPKFIATMREHAGVVAKAAQQTGFLMTGGAIPYPTPETTNVRQVLETARLYYGLKDQEATEFDVWGAVDFASVLPWGTMTKMIRVPSKMARFAGNRTVSTDLVAVQIIQDNPLFTGSFPNAVHYDPHNVLGLQTPIRSVEESLPKNVANNVMDIVRNDVGIAGDVVDKLEAIRIATRTVLETTPKTRLMEPWQLEERIRETINEVETRFKRDKIVDVHNTGEKFAISEDPETGVTSVNIFMGKRSGRGGYSSEETARRSVARRGLSVEDVTFHQNVDGQWFIGFRTDVNETGIVIPSLERKDFPLHGKLDLWGRLKAYLLSDNLNQPELFNQERILQTHAHSRLQKHVVTPLAKNIEAVGAKGFRDLEAVMAVGERKEKWFTPTELRYEYNRSFNRDPTDKEMLAYYSYIEFNDLDHTIRNLDMVGEKARRGVKTVEINVPEKYNRLGFSTGRTNGTPLKNPNFDILRVLDTEEGAVFKAGSNTEKLKTKYDTGNYEVIQLEDTSYHYDGDPVKFVLVNKRDVTIGPLDRRQLPYRAGGHRENTYKYFVKQAVKGTFKDGGTYYLSPITHIASPTDAAARDWVDEMNLARLAYNNPNMTEQEKRLIIEASPVESYEKFDQLVKEGTIRTDTPFEVVFDRGMPSEMDKIPSGVTNWAERDWTGPEGYYFSKGRMYYSKKGERLLDPQGELANILDPFVTLAKATRNSMHLQAFGQYNRKVIEDWARVAREHIDPHSLSSGDLYDIFFNGKLSQSFKSNDHRFATALENSRTSHKRFMNIRLPEDGWRYQSVRTFAEWIDKKGELGEKIAAGALDKMSGNPVTAVRGMVFDLHLGFYDPGQLFLQAQTAFAAAQMNPVYGLQATATAWPLMTTFVNRSPAYLDYVATKTAWMHRMPIDDFKEMVHYMRTSGVLDVGGEVIQLDQFSGKIGGSSAGLTFRKVRYGGRYVFNKAEQYNRLVATQIGWKIAREKLPNAKATDREFTRLVADHSSTLFFNMTTASRAWWQTGVLSVPTQFIAYQAKMLENLLPKTFGGNPYVTTRQRFGLLAGQALLYGSAGVPFGDFVFDYIKTVYEDTTGKKMSPETYRVLTKGLWDSFFYHVMGMDTDFASRAGQGAGWGQFFKKLSNGGLSNFLEVLGGPSGQLLSDAIKIPSKITDYFYAEQFGVPDSEKFDLIVGDLARNLSSLKRVQKAWWILETGRIYNPKTGRVLVEANKMEALAALLGIQLREETELWDGREFLQERADLVERLANIVAKARKDAFAAAERGDWEKAEEFSRVEENTKWTLLPAKKHYFLMKSITARADEISGKTESEWNEFKQRLENATGERPAGGE